MLPKQYPQSKGCGKKGEAGRGISQIAADQNQSLGEFCLPVQRCLGWKSFRQQGTDRKCQFRISTPPLVEGDSVFSFLTPPLLSLSLFLLPREPYQPTELSSVLSTENSDLGSERCLLPDRSHPVYVHIGVGKQGMGSEL